jgi:hypothetical protein
MDVEDRTADDLFPPVPERVGKGIADVQNQSVFQAGNNQVAGA